MAIDSLKQSALSGIRWLALRSVIYEFIAVGSTVALARLLSPSEFGHAAVADLFLVLAVVLTFEGFGSALIQRPEIEESHREVAVLMNLVAGVILGLLVLAGVRPVWEPLFGHETANLIALTAPAFVIASIGAVSRATLWRRIDMRRTTQIDLVSAFGGNVISVALAATGFGAAGLVLGSVAGVTLSSGLMLLAAREPWPRWHAREAREILSFGTFSSLNGLVWYVFSNIDYWIVAARLSAYQTGIYYRAFSLGVLYQSKISNVMLQLAFPVYSRAEDRDHVRRLHERAARVHAVVIFPILTLLIVLAPVAIPFVFGPVWTAAVTPTQILAVAGMCAAVMTGYPQVMTAVGHPGRLLPFNVMTLVVYGTAIALATSHGLIAITIAAVSVYVLILLGAYQFLLRPTIGLSLGRLFPELGPAVVSSLGLAIACEPLRLLIADLVPAPLTIVIVGLAGAVVYAAVLRLLFPAAWQDLMRLVTSIVPRVPFRRGGPTAAAADAPPQERPAVPAGTAERAAAA